MRSALLFFMLGIAACSGNQSATRGQLTARAASELRCAPERLQVTEIDPRTRVVRGCGQDATFISECNVCGPRINRYSCDCVWRSDGSARRDVAGARN